MTMISASVFRLAAYVLVVIVAIVATFTIEHRSIERERQANRIALVREQDAQLATCRRVQILRDQVNGTSLLIYDTFNSVAKQQKALMENSTGKARRQARRSYLRAKKVADTTIVTGPTDCHGATLNPDRYIPPAPEFIAKGGPHVKILRQRSEDIIRKAHLGEPLYRPGVVLNDNPKPPYGS
jgi:hypothetical protein